MGYGRGALREQEGLLSVLTALLTSVPMYLHCHLLFQLLFLLIHLRLPIPSLLYLPLGFVAIVVMHVELLVLSLQMVCHWPANRVVPFDVYTGVPVDFTSTVTESAFRHHSMWGMEFSLSPFLPPFLFSSSSPLFLLSSSPPVLLSSSVV